MLKNKNAVIYGAGGSVGSTVARAFAAAGATVFVTGQNFDSVQILAEQILVSGGKAYAAQVDAMNEEAVKSHLAGVIKQAGTVDISFNLIDLQVVQNKPLTDIAVADFVRPVAIAMQSHFITATAAARVMTKQGSGVVLSLTATPGGIGYPFTGGFAPACSAMECFSRNMAAELGIYGIRVVNIRSGGSPDSKVFVDAVAAQPDEMKIILQDMGNDTMLKKLPKMADIANTAVFLASDMAASITGVTIDVTCGTTAGLNYKVKG